PSSKAGQAVNLVLGLWLVGVGAWVARLLFGAVAGAWCGLILLFEPTHILMPTFLMSEVLCGAAFLTFLGCLIQWGQGSKAIWLPVAGVFAVLGGLTRGHVFLLVPAAIFALWVAQTLNWKRALLAVIVLGLMTTGSVGLWSERNESALGHRVLVATNAGINLLLGNNPNAKGGRADPPEGVPQTGDEVRDEQIAFDRATEYIQQNPGRSVAMLPLKAGRLWAFAPALTYRAELAEKLGKGASWAWMGLAQGVHLFLFLGLYFAFRERQKFRLGWTMVLVVALVWTAGHLPFLGGARYLFPIYTLLFVVALGSIWPRESDV
ncbi:MAG: hypothetical protein HKN21_05145, partial [Candidatus Eisenbacteria bacterium]|nr:hypothetical protein [Candidatus Eisenbacteria bacterium]